MLISIIILCLHIAKLGLNSAVIHLYSSGDDGYFMGASHNTNHKTEILASGVYVGFLIFTIAQLSSRLISGVLTHFGRKTSEDDIKLLDQILNTTGVFLWMITGAIILQYWKTFIPSNHFTITTTGSNGQWMGALTVVNGGVYFLEIVFTIVLYRINQNKNSRRRQDF